MRSSFYTFVATVVTAASLYAGDQMTVPVEVAPKPASTSTDSKDMKDVKSFSDVADTTTATNYDWSLEAGSGVQFSNVRDGKLDGYTMVPANITASLKLDDVSLSDKYDGIFRGYTEFRFQGYGYAITHGPAGESEIVGANFGPRYNFVQPGWKIVPSIGALVGFGFADSNPTVVAGEPHGLGQDFNFTFSTDISARYDITDVWFARVSAIYTHFSNAGLSEPEHPNRAIDAVGPQVSVGYRF